MFFLKIIDKKAILLLAFFIANSFAYSQDESISEEDLASLNENFKTIEYKNQFKVLAYRYSWNQRSKKGIITLSYKEYTQNRTNSKDNLNWSEFKTLVYLLENNKDVILNNKTGNVYSKYRRTGE